MTTLELRGRITDTGELKVELPAGLPSGEVTVRIDVPSTSGQSESEWTSEELDQALNSPKRSLRELANWLKQHPPLEQWGDLSDAEDAAEYLHQQRRKSQFSLDDLETGN